MRNIEVESKCSGVSNREEPRLSHLKSRKDTSSYVHWFCAISIDLFQQCLSIFVCVSYPCVFAFTIEMKVLKGS